MDPATFDRHLFNRPGGPVVEVRHPAIVGREVERRRLVDAVRRIVAVAPALDGVPIEGATMTALDDLVSRLGVLVVDEEERLARLMPPLPSEAEGGAPRPFGEVDIRSSVVVGNATGMVSGMYSPISPSVLDVEDGRVVGHANFGDLYRAPGERGRGEGGEVHDGVILACFDVVLAMALRLRAMFGPTMELSSTRLAPTLVGVPCRFEADVDWHRERVAMASGRLVQNGQVTVEANGAFRRFDQAGIEAIGRLRGTAGALASDVTRGDVP